jgi:hypothetical protein
MGYNVFRGAKKPIRLSIADRQRHMYVVGQTGTGKSTFLENLALQDMLNGNGFAFVDPHGDTAEKLLSMVPKERTEDVIYFSPAEMDYPMGLNLFEYSLPEQKDFLIQEALNMLQKLYDPQHQGIMGPRYEHIFRNAALAVMADPAGGTFVDIPKLFRDPQFLKQKLQHVTDMNVLEFWQKEYPASQRSNEAGEVTSWFVSKFGAFLSNEMMRNIIGQTKSAFDLRDIMDNKKILLVNLSKGRTGELNSKRLGKIFVMKFQAAAMSRANVPESERQDFALYVDEFQNFSTDSFATIMSEARKYHLNLIVANQFTTQLTPEIRDAVFGNIGTIVAFRVGQQDVETISKYFHPIFDEEDLLRVPNYNAIVRTLVGGVPTQPFSMASLPPLGTANDKLLGALKQLSAAKYGKPKSTVEADIFERMATKTPTPPARPAFGGAAPSPFGAAAPNPMQSNPFASPAPAGASPFGGGAPAGLSPLANGNKLKPFAAPAGAVPANTLPPNPFASPAPALPSAAPAAPRPAAAPAAPAGANPNFLDDWLSKRRPANAPAPAVPNPMQSNPFAAPPAASLSPASLAPEEASDRNSVSGQSRVLSHHQSPSLRQEPGQDFNAATDPAMADEPNQPPAVELEPLSVHPAPEAGKPADPAAHEPAPQDEAAVPELIQQNISSDAIEQTEVDKIAEELQQQIKGEGGGDGDGSSDDQTAAVEESIDNIQPHMQAQPAHEADEEDTIIIDADGNMQIKSNEPTPGNDQDKPKEA